MPLLDAKGRPVELCDYDANHVVGVQIGELGHKLWVCIDGVAVLRVNAPLIELTDHRLGVHTVAVNSDLLAACKTMRDRLVNLQKSSFDVPMLDKAIAKAEKTPAIEAGGFAYLDGPHDSDGIDIREEIEVTSEKSVEDTMELNEAFERVTSIDDWRAPIDCVLSESDEKKRRKIVEAIEFYTATKATVTHLSGDKYQFQADGYRQGPAGP